jgi:hypothetical protein
MTAAIWGDSYKIGVFWGARDETLADVAARFIGMLEGLGRCKPTFDRWVQSGSMTRREGGVPIATLPLQLDPMIRRLDVETRDMHHPGDPVEDRSLHARNLTLGSEVGMSFSLSRGLRAKTYPSGSEIAFPYQTEREYALVTDDFMRATLLAMIDAWQPMIGRVDAPDLVEHWQEIKAEGDDRALRAGWMTYLAPPLAGLVAPPSSAIVEKMPGGGVLISATAERFDMENPHHLAVYDEIQASMAPLRQVEWPFPSPL